ncbi:MAG: helix-turn-helix transcriptional regulator [bacterium]
MLIIELKIRTFISQRGITLSELAGILKYDVGFLHNVLKGKRSMPEAMADNLQKLFQITENDLIGWTIADKYTLNSLKSALAEKELNVKSSTVFTDKINGILRQKGFSRTDLSKIISYSQSALNQIITGKRPLSAVVAEKLSTSLDIPLQEIIGWNLADKYSLESIKTANEEKSRL